MTDKKIINIIYTPGKGPPTKMFENEQGEIWNSNKYDDSKINIGMSWYSLRDPKPGDSLLVVEPICVNPRDYNLKFTQKFKHIFTWTPQAFPNPQVKPKVIGINHPTYHNFPNPDQLQKKWAPWEQRKNKIIFIANNKSSQHHSELYSLRILLADILDSSSKFEVEWYAQIPIKRKYYKGKIDNKNDILGKSKFSVCTENCYHPIYSHNYFTEKMPDVWKAGAVPIYFGCHNIDSFQLPSNSYLDLRPFCQKEGKRWKINKKGLIEKIESYSADQHQKYLNNLYHQVFANGKLKKLSSFDQAYQKILATFANK